MNADQKLGRKMYFRIFGSIVVMIILVTWFQNCMGTVSFKSFLRAGNVDSSGNVDNFVPDLSPSPGDSPSPSPTQSPSPSVDPSVPDGSPSPSPSESPSPTPSPSPSPTVASGNEQLCIITTESGQSNKVGYDKAVVTLSGNNGVPGAVCMSSNACLNLINDYLNLTGGIFGGHIGATPAVSLNYTMQKINSVCQSNPNVVHLSDAQVQQEIFNLKSGH